MQFMSNKRKYRITQAIKNASKKKWHSRERRFRGKYQRDQDAEQRARGESVGFSTVIIAMLAAIGFIYLFKVDKIINYLVEFVMF